MSRRIATIGFFDGVHLGHRFLIGQVLDIAQKNGGESLIVTMYPHPRAIVQPGFQPQLLTTLDEKLNLLKKTGISKVEVLQFDKEMSRLSARDFMEQILHEKLGIDCLVMGYDHRFGHGGGTIEQYRGWGKELGIEVLQMEAFSGEYVSSSAIRKLLFEGNVEKAAKLLGRPYELCGNVVDGYKVGRTIGFPTANLCPEKGKLIPVPGVYAVWVGGLRPAAGSAAHDSERHRDRSPAGACGNHRWGRNRTRGRDRARGSDRTGYCAGAGTHSGIYGYRRVDDPGWGGHCLAAGGGKL